MNWLRGVPSHWTVVPLRRVLHRIEQGWSPVAEDRQAEDGEWAVIKLSAVGPACFNDNEHKALAAETTPDPRFEIRAGDLLLTRANTPDLVGEACVVTDTKPHLMLCDLVYRLGVNDSMMGKQFLVYWLTSRPGRAQVEADARGSSQSMVKVSQGHIRSWIAVVPPLAEQRAIADFLDRKTAAIDALIAKKERFIELLAEKRQSLIDEAATGGASPAPTTRRASRSWLPSVPVGWTVKRLKYIAVIHSGIAKGRQASATPTMKLPYLRVANVQNGYLDLTELTELEVTPEEARRFALKPGDVLMNEGGDFDKLGRGYVWEGQVSPCLHQNHVFAVRPRPGVDSSWVNLATQASYLRHFFILRSKQTTNLASISSTNLGEAPVLLPPREEVEAILRRLDASMTHLAAVRKVVLEQVERLREYRQTLITAAVTGQLDMAAQPQEAA